MATHNYEGSEIVSAHASKEGADKEACRLTAAMEVARKRLQEALDDDTEKTPIPDWPEDVPNCDSFYVSGEWPVQP
jgi:hypothetical protein